MTEKERHETPEGADGATPAPYEDESDWHEQVYEEHVKSDNPELHEAMKRLREKLGAAEKK